MWELRLIVGAQLERINSDSMMFLTCVTFVKGVTSQSVMLQAGKEMLGKALKKSDV